MHRTLGFERARRGLACAMVMTLGACGAEVEAPARAADALIGGERAEVGEFPSTVLVMAEYDVGGPEPLAWPTCTAAKVGPRHLLIAAHCVVEPDRESGTAGVRPQFAAGARIRITSAPHLPSTFDAPTTALTVAQTSAFPAYVAACEADPATCGYVGGGSDSAPDVAVIEVTEDIAGVPSARVDLRPVLIGEPLAIQGFGCRDSVLTQETYQELELRWARTYAMPPDGSAYSDVFRDLTPAQYRERVSPHYIVTPGPTLAADQGGLCPGDSGGPIYRRQGKNDVVVGVNSSYGFAWDEAAQDWIPIPLTNWHTRLDAAAGERVSAWLAAAGVQMTLTLPLGIFYEVVSCPDGFDRRRVGLGGTVCVERESGRADASMATLDMLTECWARRDAAGEPRDSCHEPLWDYSEFVELRGDGYCAIGDHFDVRIGACVSGFSVHGQLPARVRDACVAAGEACEGSSPAAAAVHRALEYGALTPVAECVRRGVGGQRARFRAESSALRPVHVAAGADNHLEGAGDRAPPTDFTPGRAFAPFEVPFDGRTPITWTLVGADGVARSATIDARTPRCR